MASYAPSEKMNREAPNADTAEAHIGDLRGETFPNHPKVGEWYTLKGDECKPWELETLESTSGGSARHQAPTRSPEWNSTIIVQTGSTGPDGSGATYRSHIPNH